MVNPLRGIFLNGQWFNYESDSFREQVGLKNSSVETQNSRSFNVQGKTSEQFTITLELENTYEIHVGTSQVGSTTWLGLSRLSNLKTIIGGQGVSMPIIFVTPYGLTYNVVPSGMIDISVFNPSNPSENSMEFKVSLSLDVKP